MHLRPFIRVSLQYKPNRCDVTVAFIAKVLGSHASLLYINISTRFIRVAYRRKRRNADLHNAMHYATINMRDAESERR